MIAERIHRSAAHLAATVYYHAVGKRIRLSAESAYHRRRRFHSVRLLDAQLFRTANDAVALGVHTENGKQREFVDK